MNRYRISRADFPAVRKYLAGKSFKKDAPSFARKFKDDLSFKGNTLYFKDQEVIPTESIDDYLRAEFYDPKSVLPMARDGAFHKLKQRNIVGITRARLMKFIKSQPAAESVRHSIAKPKRAGGVKRKRFHIESDLVFLRKPDFVKIDSKFEETIDQFESYICSTCEAVTGLCRLDYIKHKDETMPVLIKQIKSIAKQLGVKDLKTFTGASDKGEVKIKEIQKIIPDWKIVSRGAKIEQQNSSIQKHLFRIARMKRGYDLKNLLQQTEAIANENMNKNFRKTANEIATEMSENPENTKKIIKQFNKSRKTEIATVKTKFKVGDHVRLMIIKQKNKGIAFKSYKNLTFSKRVYKITKATQQSLPQKYYVNRKWYTANVLLKTEEVDVTSVALVNKREQAQKESDDKAHKAHMARRKAELEKEEKRNREEDAAEQKRKQDEYEKRLAEHEAAKKKKKPKPRKKKPRKKKPRDDDDEYVPEVDVAPQAPRRRLRRSAAVVGRQKKLKKMEELRELDESIKIRR
jgi:hypothetical protein